MDREKVKSVGYNLGTILAIIFMVFCILGSIIIGAGMLKWAWMLLF